MDPYVAQTLPLPDNEIDATQFMEELIDATAKLEVYKEKIKDSKLDSSWFMPTLQQKEALASSTLEGTQATLDGVLINQAVPDKKAEEFAEVARYFKATKMGYKYLSKEHFTVDFIREIHNDLMKGSTRNFGDAPGEFRTQQNYIGKTSGDHGIVFTPPVPESVDRLMENLVQYIENRKDNLRPLVRAAIIHAQFLTIHPFMDGNGRVGRILIPLYLYYCGEIELPCFFISEALERDKFKYYKFLNETRTSRDWNSWIKFFLTTVNNQCAKYLKIIAGINDLYDRDLKRACCIMNSSKMVDIMNLLYKYPVITSGIIVDNTDMSVATANRYLSALVKNDILFTAGEARNRTYYYYDLLDIIRD